jgi:hypothetical protein
MICLLKTIMHPSFVSSTSKGPASSGSGGVLGNVVGAIGSIFSSSSSSQAGGTTMDHGYANNIN